MRVSKSLIIFLVIAKIFTKGVNFKNKNTKPLDFVVGGTFGQAESPDQDDIICVSNTHLSIVSGDSPVVKNTKFPSKHFINAVNKKIFVDEKSRWWEINDPTGSSKSKSLELASTIKFGGSSSAKSYNEKIKKEVESFFLSKPKEVPKFEKVFTPLTSVLTEKSKTFSDIFEGFVSKQMVNLNVPPEKDERRPLINQENMKLNQEISTQMNKLINLEEEFLNMHESFENKLNTKINLSSIVLHNQKNNQEVKEGGFLGMGKKVVYHRRISELIVNSFGKNAAVVFKRVASVKDKTQYIYYLSQVHYSSLDKNIVTFPEHTTSSFVLNEDTIDKSIIPVSEKDIVGILSKKVMNTIPIGFITYLLAYTAKKLGDDYNWNPETDTKIEERTAEVLEKLSNVINFNDAYYQITKSKNFENMKKTPEFNGKTGLSTCPLEEFFHGQISKKIPKPNCIFKFAKEDSSTVGDVEVVRPIPDKVFSNFNPKVFFRVIKKVMDLFFTEAAKENKQILTLENLSYWNKAVQLQKNIPKFKEVLSYPSNHFSDPKFENYYKPKRDHYGLFVDILTGEIEPSKNVKCGMPSKISNADFKNDIKAFYSESNGEPIKVTDIGVSSVEDSQIKKEDQPHEVHVSTNVTRMLSLSDKKVDLKEKLIL